MLLFAYGRNKFNSLNTTANFRSRERVTRPPCFLPRRLGTGESEAFVYHEDVVVSDTSSWYVIGYRSVA